MRKKIREIINIGNIGLSIIFISMCLFWINLFTEWFHPLFFLGCMIGGFGIAMGDLIV